MAYLLIGRIQDHTVLTSVSAATITKTSMSFRGRIGLGGADLAAIAAVRDQIIGLTENTDEPVVPMLYSGDLSLTSFVRPVSASVTLESGSIDVGYWEWEIEVERLPRGGARQQSTFSGTCLVNPFSVVEADTRPWHATPSEAVGYGYVGINATVAVQAGTRYARYGPGVDTARPGGQVWVYDPDDATYFTGNADWVVDPRDFYSMAATIKAGAALKAVHGRLTSKDVTSAGWQIGNGLFRFGPSSTGLISLTAPSATASVWGTPVQLSCGYTTGGTWTPFTAADITDWMVLRNSPECCVLRLRVSTTSASLNNVIIVDILVRRGSRFAVINLSGGLFTQYGIGFTSAKAMTAKTESVHATTVGLKETTADTDGNKLLFILGSVANTRDTANGRIYTTSNAFQTQVMVGHEYQGATAAAIDDDDVLIHQYFAAQTETQRIVL